MWIDKQIGRWMDGQRRDREGLKGTQDSERETERQRGDREKERERKRERERERDG